MASEHNVFDDDPDTEDHAKTHEETETKHTHPNHHAHKQSAQKATGSKAPLLIVAAIIIAATGFGGYKALSSKTPPAQTIVTADGCGAPGSSCSVASIAKHNKQSDCWVIFDGSYYNVTPFVAKHPGSADAFNSNSCGKDITQYLIGQKDNDGLQHLHTSKAYSTLATFKVGPVK